MDSSLTLFLEEEIIPRYAGFDKAHQEDHARAVVARALELAAFYPVKKELVYAAAACHDLGLAVDRKTHHLHSGRIIREMPELRRWFTEEEIETIAQAAEDHRASSDHAPRSLYGRIVAEADRLIDPVTIKPLDKDIIVKAQWGHYAFKLKNDADNADDLKDAMSNGEALPARPDIVDFDEAFAPAE